MLLHKLLRKLRVRILRIDLQGLPVARQLVHHVVRFRVRLTQRVKRIARRRVALRVPFENIDRLACVAAAEKYVAKLIDGLLCDDGGRRVFRAKIIQEGNQFSRILFRADLHYRFTRNAAERILVAFIGRSRARRPRQCCAYCRC